MGREEILKNANVPEEYWDKCYITQDNMIFTPINNKTAEEVYKEWLENKDKEVIKEPTTQEKLNSTLLKANADIQLELKKQQVLNATLLKQIADLKGDK